MDDIKATELACAAQREIQEILRRLEEQTGLVVSDLSMRRATVQRISEPCASVVRTVSIQFEDKTIPRWG